MATTVTCVICKRALPVTCFSVGYLSPNRIAYARCDDCVRAAANARLTTLGIDVEERARLAAEGLKRCTVCEAVKPLTDYSVLRGALSAACKACDAERCRAWRERQSEAERRAKGLRTRAKRT